MNLVILIALGVLVISIVVIVSITMRHISQLRILNVETDTKAKSRKKKEEIILKRLSSGSAPAAKLGRAMSKTLTHLRRTGRKSIHRLRDLEAHYRDLKKKGSGGESLTTDQLAKAFDEASQLLREDKIAQAEKKYIEIISLNPREVKAYENLGRLYTKTKQFDQAEQSLRFASKLSPNDASVSASLGELYMTEEQWTRALEELGKAIEKRSGNAKYLDRYIETALQLKDSEKALSALEQLKTSNPENQKIAEFEERIEALQ